MKMVKMKLARVAYWSIPAIAYTAMGLVVLMGLGCAIATLVQTPMMFFAVVGVAVSLFGIALVFRCVYEWAKRNK